ncbi:NAD-dependent dihydropyrimidine dehydrogenase PreA subunit [Parabacteroides sp. PF5-5]|uniref:ATP-binding protein n=1 Tax=unclassified Parabacteroides TaxID=2649774 RepID=UPI00247727CD|nr:MULTISPECIES: 4Fe-4S dicluster domain-containing protein [unclassified Parabacteroides]MDH6303698.1 NAD-dependent dihydropyrimidine dehydrogenase PreA subunit [Parabacteroides sp. PH5-39]MDH6314315.1 NAD-dependent dihydropyrimidine dehydrogenase PreA subunit [Parabacteroides sp. PF5-13]MDH6318621.1 NAD-dependent dihydropyrimidine dehydrogenase PreA subunit [Parabacteroides sp. PH5-13]MDH6322087.1 NAD-dependent dihydropyrimidine dehydrogenase PreA subunit [Parabacteroides sp. PH5-8]MDH632583
MKRTIIKINEELCNGCGICVKGCHEGALQLIDGKARMISDMYCDGLGACIGDCPVGAIELEEREAEPYNEALVMDRMEIPFTACPGSKEMSFAPVGPAVPTGNTPSQLRQWPVQLHLLNPQAGYFRGADVVLAADCTAYAYGGFHERFLRNRTLAIACPKLDSNKDIYVSKIVDMINGAQINTLTVIIMEVPCCGGLLQLVKMALEQASNKVPVKRVVIGIQGDIIEKNWI